MTNEEKQKRRDEVEDVLSCFAVIVFMFAMYLAVIVFGPTPAPSQREEPTPCLPSVANGGFAPLSGAAATPVAALKTPVARREWGSN
jgi:hypothetical protein